MKSRQLRKSGFSLLTALLLCAVLASGCAKSPVPPAGSRANSVQGKPAVFNQTARSLQEHCQSIGGCTCFLDGIQTTCSVVFACLDAGFCELVRAS